MFGRSEQEKIDYWIKFREKCLEQRKRESELERED